MNWFLQTAAQPTLSGGEVSAILGAIIGFLIVIALISLAIWIYMSFAFMRIARKAEQSAPGLAWIPGVGPLIVAFRASGMHWWPWLLLISLLIVWIPVIGGIIYAVCIIIFTIYSIIWTWKMFEAINKPGWWAILMLIPLVNLIIIGIAAWSD